MPGFALRVPLLMLACLLWAGCIELPALPAASEQEDARVQPQWDMGGQDVLDGGGGDASQGVRDRACVMEELVACHNPSGQAPVDEQGCGEVPGCMWRLSATGGVCAPTGCVKHAPGARACADKILQAWCVSGRFDLMPGVDTCALKAGCAQKLPGKCVPERCPVVGPQDSCVWQTRKLETKDFTGVDNLPNNLGTKDFKGLAQCNSFNCGGECACQWQGGSMESCGRAGLSAFLVNGSVCLGGGETLELWYTFIEGRGKSLYTFNRPRDEKRCASPCQWFERQGVCLGKEFGESIQASLTQVEDRCWHSPWLGGCVVLECPGVGGIGVLRGRLEGMLDAESRATLNNGAHFSVVQGEIVVVRAVERSDAAAQLCGKLQGNKALYSD